MAEKHKSNKLKARLPRGLADRGPAEIAATREMIEKIRVVYERYGFEPVETPAIEYTDALGKFLPDQDRPNEGVFSFQDDDEQWLSLRYDLTAPLARYVAERVGTENLVLPYRSYRVGWVFRNEKPGPGRFRQFMQFDADTVGSASPAADAEMCMMAADTMEALGIPRGSFVVKVWNRNIWDGLKLTLGVANDAQWLTVLRAIDKLDRLGIGGVQELLGSKRVDQSGDVTPGAGLSIPANNFITSTLTFTTVSRPRDTLIPVTGIGRSVVCGTAIFRGGISPVTGREARRTAGTRANISRIRAPKRNSKTDCFGGLQRFRQNRSYGGPRPGVLHRNCI